MKTPEEALNHISIEYGMTISTPILKEFVLNLMKEYGKHEFNRALELAAKNATIKTTDGHQDLRKFKEYSVDKQSILKLRIQ